jgi:hypothetical protein
MLTPTLVPLFHLDIDLGDPIITAGPFGTQLTMHVVGGRFEGERLSGDVLPGGGDWLTVDAENTWHVDVRAILAITGGPHVRVSYTGRIVLPEGGMERLLVGEELAAEELYFRTAPTFTTEAGDFGWLNKIQALGVGSMSATAVRYDVFEVA